jgi:transcriptional regulator with XRE-family HTH domain
MYFYRAPGRIVAVTLGDRIRERLEVLGISQAELARRARVPQTTLNGLVNSDARSTPHLVKIAQALQTTAAYLTGDTHDPALEAAPAAALASDEERLLTIYRQLTKSDRAALRRLLARMASDGPDDD